MLTQMQVKDLSTFVIDNPTYNEAYIVYNKWAIRKSISFSDIKDVEWCLNFITDILKIKQNKVLNKELI